MCPWLACSTFAGVACRRFAQEMLDHLATDNVRVAMFSGEFRHDRPHIWRSRVEAVAQDLYRSS